MQHTTSAAISGEGRPDRLVPCPDCGGHGEFVEPEPVYDARSQQWFPNYVMIPCARCESLGYLDLDHPRRSVIAFDRLA